MFPNNHCSFLYQRNPGIVAILCCSGTVVYLNLRLRRIYVYMEQHDMTSLASVLPNYGIVIRHKKVNVGAFFKISLNGIPWLFVVHLCIILVVRDPTRRISLKLLLTVHLPWGRPVYIISPPDRDRAVPECPVPTKGKKIVPRR